MNGNLSSNYSHNTTHGWVPQVDGRGTLDILWSCTITIFLCCWTSVCANIPAKKDSNVNRFRDKFDLACLGILGPEFLFTLALGQYDSARYSVELFHAAGYSSWTMTHAFFADMGGFVLQTPDWKPFPLDAKQLYYMISQGYLKYPEVDKEAIDDKDKADGVARVITVIQVLWFGINCIGRFGQRMALTTLELTTLAFIFMMLATSVCWRHKPLDVSYPIVLETDVTIAEVLKKAGPDAQDPYKHTPLDFVSRKEWFLSRLWAHYVQILRKLHIRMFSRPIEVRPIDRIPSDNFLEISSTNDGYLTAFILAAYAAIFLSGWNLSFPTRIERTLWRATSIYNMVYMWLGTAVVGWYQRLFLPYHNVRDPPAEKAGKPTPKRSSNWFRRRTQGAISWMRNNSPDHDPAMETPLRMLIPATALCFLYSISRIYILVEDFIGLRLLPSSAFDTVNWSGVFPHF